MDRLFRSSFSPLGTALNLLEALDPGKEDQRTGDLETRKCNSLEP